MISRISYLPKGLTLEKLIYPTHDLDSDDFSSHEDDIIYETDQILINIQNTEDISYIQFHIKNDDDFFIHHDIITAETLTEILYYKGSKDLVAVSGFFNDIYFYDCFLFNPIDYEYKLTGHSGYINQMALENNNLYSASDDKSVIEWDLETGKIKEKIEFKAEVKHLAIHGERMCTGSEFELFDVFKNDAPIELVRLRDENTVFFGDDKGFLKSIDLRMNKVVNSKKFHNETLTDFCFYGEEVLSVGFDGKIMRIDKDFESFVACKTCDQLACISIDEKKTLCAYGGIDDKIKFLDL